MQFGLTVFLTVDRCPYRLNGRRETLTIGRYGTKDGISLLMARERCMEVRKAIAQGV